MEPSNLRPALSSPRSCLSLGWLVWAKLCPEHMPSSPARKRSTTLGWQYHKAGGGQDGGAQPEVRTIMMDYYEQGLIDVFRQPTRMSSWQAATFTGSPVSGRGLLQMRCSCSTTMTSSLACWSDTSGPSPMCRLTKGVCLDNSYPVVWKKFYKYYQFLCYSTFFYSMFF